MPLVLPRFLPCIYLLPFTHTRTRTALRVPLWTRVLPYARYPRVHGWFLRSGSFAVGLHTCVGSYHRTHTHHTRTFTFTVTTGYTTALYLCLCGYGYVYDTAFAVAAAIPYLPHTPFLCVTFCLLPPHHALPARLPPALPSPVAVYVCGSQFVDSAFTLLVRLLRCYCTYAVARAVVYHHFTVLATHAFRSRYAHTPPRALRFCLPAAVYTRLVGYMVRLLLRSHAHTRSVYVGSCHRRARALLLQLITAPTPCYFTCWVPATVGYLPATGCGSVYLPYRAPDGLVTFTVRFFTLPTRAYLPVPTTTHTTCTYHHWLLLCSSFVTWFVVLYAFTPHTLPTIHTVLPPPGWFPVIPIYLTFTTTTLLPPYSTIYHHPRLVRLFTTTL